VPVRGVRKGERFNVSSRERRGVHDLLSAFGFSQKKAIRNGNGENLCSIYFNNFLTVMICYFIEIKSMKSNCFKTDLIEFCFLTYRHVNLFQYT